jgi:large subunit ribosomal protein L9
MPKTEVILIQNVVGLGGESDQVKVSAGYARNYLLPQGLAIPLSNANKRRLEVLRQRRGEREAHELQAMSELAKGVKGFPPLIIKVKTGEDGKMFGSVTVGSIADELKRQFDVLLDKKKIHIDKPIRALGDYEIDLRLHPEVHAALKIKVESTTPPPPVEAAAVPGDKKGDARGDRKGDIHFGKGDRPERKPRAPRAPKAE